VTLLVVPVAPAEASLLTLAEWDELSARSQVLFEDLAHPLLERLRTAGIAAGPFDDEPRPDDAERALVADPSSPRVLDLARKGARVLAGPSDPPDPVTAAHGAVLVRRAAASLAQLALVMARLRSADGCPWDLEQTHESLAVHLVEETYEVIDAIDRDEVGPELQEELGDVLLQVVFHAELARQDDRFDLAAVADTIVAKLVHRHPHVFGDVRVGGAEEVLRNWEHLKAAEKQRTDPFDGIPPALPALLQAAKVQKRAAELGFRPDEREARMRLEHVARDGLDDRGIGEALFWMVALARAGHIDPEAALRSTTARFRGSLG